METTKNSKILQRTVKAQFVNLGFITLKMSVRNILFRVVLNKSLFHNRQSTITHFLSNTW